MSSVENNAHKETPPEHVPGLKQEAPSCWERQRVTSLWQQGNILLIIHLHRFSRKCRTKQIKSQTQNIKEAILMLKKILWCKNDPIKQPVIFVLIYGCHYLEVIWIRMYFLPSFLQSVRWSVSSGGSDKTNHSVSVYIQPHNLKIYCL